jgi:predicted enzyme related to lactoylglutathione lyase
MLRGLATVNYWADDLQAAKEWYSELLGIDPYFERAELDGRIVAPGEPGYDQAQPAYIEFRLGDYQHELGLIDSRYASEGSASGPASAVVYWHVDDVAATFQRLLAMGAHEHHPITPRGEEGFVTASVVDPFGNVVGIMYNPHYLEVLDSSRKAWAALPAGLENPLFTQARRRSLLRTSPRWSSKKSHGPGAVPIGVVGSHRLAQGIFPTFS